MLADALVAVHDTPLGPLVGEATLRGIGARDRMCELDFELPLAGGDVTAGRPGRAVARGSPTSGRCCARTCRRATRCCRTPTCSTTRGTRPRCWPATSPGSVDVVLRVPVDGVERFVVVDYKTNWLGAPDEELTQRHYRPEALAEAMTHSSYPLQALLYAVVLHRFLRWRLPGYDPRARTSGGVLYLYLRGHVRARDPRRRRRAAAACSRGARRWPWSRRSPTLLDGTERR